jgi:hypothetical protein
MTAGTTRVFSRHLTKIIAAQDIYILQSARSSYIPQPFYIRVMRRDAFAVP